MYQQEFAEASFVEASRLATAEQLLAFVESQVVHLVEVTDLVSNELDGDDYDTASDLMSYIEELQGLVSRLVIEDKLIKIAVIPNNQRVHLYRMITSGRSDEAIQYTKEYGSDMDITTKIIKYYKR